MATNKSKIRECLENNRRPLWYLDELVTVLKSILKAREDSNYARKKCFHGTGPLVLSADTLHSILGDNNPSAIYPNGIYPAIINTLYAMGIVKRYRGYMSSTRPRAKGRRISTYAVRAPSSIIKWTIDELLTGTLEKI
ncbi:MAG: hypothetical protein D6698_04015 [Gammaproteobacteria bacterium]|nr:MAG: hypothetical protein D6698_04015 [Gammaproteobacteria bacterium]